MEYIYLNNAATSWPKAPGIEEAISKQIVSIPDNAQRSGFDTRNIMCECRQALAKIFGIENYNRIILTPSATISLNMVLNGLNLQERAGILTSVAEHNSVLRPLNRISKNNNIKIYYAPVDTSGKIIEDSWNRLVKEKRPNVVIVTHASNVTGSINDIKPLFDIAKKYETLTILDASQTAGLIDVKPFELNADIVIFPGHKYLLGPQGTGGFFLKEGIDLVPYITGGTGIKSDLLEMPDEVPMKYEAGTPNEPAFAGLEHALFWQRTNPIELKNLDSLKQLLIDGLVELGVSVISKKDFSTPVISFNLKGISPEEAGYILQKSFGIICRTGLHCAPLIHKYIKSEQAGTIRFSLSRFTTKDNINYTLDSLRKILQ